jgi:hypothetical protein
MIKNVIIGILLVFSLFFFFYGLTQQLKAENYEKLLRKSEAEAVQQREMMEAAVKQAQRQVELARLEFERATKVK